MEYPITLQLILHAFALILFRSDAIDGETDCPLQCVCNKIRAGISVKCVDPKFSELPVFPQSSTYVIIKGKSKVSKVSQGALSGASTGEFQYSNWRKLEV